jgi:hypothetical protein
MNTDEFADYTLWLQLANDPSQTEQARQRYRARMQEFMRARMRDAFRAASAESPRGAAETNGHQPLILNR